jgi:DNA-binding transcriptional ArsR family regulator
MENRPAFTAQMPPAVRYSYELSSTAKLLFCEISALTLAEGFCWASNDYFSMLFDISRDRISRLIRSLKNAGFIETKLDKRRGNYREIYILPAAFMGCKSPGSSVVAPIGKNNNTCSQKDQDLLVKKPSPIGEKVKSYIGEKYKGKIGEKRSLSRDDEIRLQFASLESQEVAV